MAAIQEFFVALFIVTTTNGLDIMLLKIKRNGRFEIIVWANAQLHGKYNFLPTQYEPKVFFEAKLTKISAQAKSMNNLRHRSKRHR